MSALFLKLLNMSITASWIILIVIILRILLKKGDIVSCSITWSNDDGNLYLGIGTEYGYFNNKLITSGTGVCLLEQDIEITQDGTFYIFIGNQNTYKANIADVKGTVTIYRS